MATMRASEERIPAGDSDPEPRSANAQIAVVIPCHDEAGSIGRVVGRFRSLLPGADVVVIDNASTDGTAEEARAAGARVVPESRLGKGFALVTGFSETRDADYVVMVDGDDTYPAAAVTALLEAATERHADMVIGTRLDGADPSAFPRGHGLGNRLFIALVRLLFGIRTRDLFSGYRVLSRRFLDTAPLVATGFDVEAELSVQARVHGFRVAEVPVEYRARPAGGRSKLNTIRDGYRILLGITILFRDYRPMAFFGGVAAALVVAGLWSGYAPIDDFLRTGLVHHLPRAVLAAALFILAALSIALGILLSSINRRAVELAALIRKRSS
jgi:glycosyltransferase involved in cell wall biosynthesis